MRLERDGATLEILERVVNEGNVPLPFAWGHHLVLGGTFLEQGCRLEIPAGSIHTHDDLYEPATARLAPGQHEPWPMARGRREAQVDLRDVPGPAAHSHDDAFATDLTDGWARVENPRLGLAFRLDWDPEVFPWVTIWQPYGGAEEPPITGIYGLGIEPWTSDTNLRAAVARGDAPYLDPAGVLVTRLAATVEDNCRDGLRRI